MTTEIKEKETTVEQDLYEIRQCKIDILMLQRANDKLCEANNEEIARLAKVIEYRETSAKEKLTVSGEKKIDTPAGFVSFRAMPDKWEYEDKEIIAWCKENDVPYYKTKEEVEKMKLKTAILNGVFKLDSVPGLTVTPQDPKFTYKLKGDLL